MLVRPYAPRPSPPPLLTLTLQMRSPPPSPTRLGAFRSELLSKNTDRETHFFHACLPFSAHFHCFFLRLCTQRRRDDQNNKMYSYASLPPPTGGLGGCSAGDPTEFCQVRKSLFFSPLFRVFAHLSIFFTSMVVIMDALSTDSRNLRRLVAGHAHSGRERSISQR